MGYLLFQLWSHAQLYQDDAPDVAKSTEYEFFVRRREKKAAQKTSQQNLKIIPNESMRTEPESVEPIVARTTSPQDIYSTTADVANGITPEQPAIAVNPGQDEETGSIEEVEKPQMNVLVTVGLLAIVTVVSICLETLMVLLIPPCSIAGGSNFRISCDFNQGYDGRRYH
jgi:Ca2+:H+ antiporter